jgi:hypothetical protein
MAQNKDDLKWLLNLVEKISKEEGNEWFKDALKKKLAISDFKEIGFDTELDKLISDIRRTKYYLQSIDRSIWLEGIKFYEKIKYPELRMELIVDYKEMKIAERNNDLIEYTRRIVMQLENCVNYTCQLVNAHSIIKSTPEKFSNKTTNLHYGEYSFFDRDGIEKSLSLINITSKLFFVKQHYHFNYSFDDMKEMIAIRNNSSHRGKLKEKDAEIITKAKENLMERKASYFKCYDLILQKLQDIHN